MALGRLGKNSTMIFCGDNQQIDLKDKNYSAIVDMSKLVNSNYVFKTVLEDNHRHEAIDEVLTLLTGY
jgi:phosphate starvation-inducible protein PhoH